MKCLLSGVLVILITLSAPAGGRESEPLSSWRDVVMATAYWESQGVHANLKTIRHWVLTRGAFCEEMDRHILFDRRMRFLGYLTDAGRRTVNQHQINEQRLRLARTQKVDAWVPGTLDQSGYPFVLSCHQPDAYLPELVDGYVGAERSARLWGTWDGMKVGTQDQPVSLHDAIGQVFQHRRAAGRTGLPEHTLSVLAGKVIIESGGVREALSPVGAIGIMQLSAAALDDCRLKEPFQLHRLAQIDCALYLLEQNQRNLEPAFRERFGQLPSRKAEELFRMLLVQAYHSGVGRISALLTDESLNRPARYFAEHSDRFSAGDIALGMIYHNLGREQLGFAALYYVVDVSIAIEAACERVQTLAGCP